MSDHLEQIGPVAPSDEQLAQMQAVIFAAHNEWVDRLEEEVMFEGRPEGSDYPIHHVDASASNEQTAELVDDIAKRLKALSLKEEPE